MPDPAPTPSSLPNPTESPAPIATENARPPTNQIARSVPCLTCGYDLRGLQPTGACPECNRDISESLRGDWLRFADPRWLHGIELGARLSIYSRRIIGYGLIALIFLFFFALAVGFAGAHPLLGIFVAFPFYAAIAAVGFSIMGIIVSQWLTAAPDPSDQTRAAWSSSVTYSIIGVAPLAAGAFVTAAIRSGTATPGSRGYFIELACVMIMWAHVVVITGSAWRLRRRCMVSLEHFEWRRPRPAAPVFFWPGAVIIADYFARSSGAEIFSLYFIAWIVIQLRLVGWNKHILTEADAAKQMKEQNLIAPATPRPNP
jgi:hypothetical protein